MLRKICSSQAILPMTYEVSGELSFTAMEPVAFAGFSDIYKGFLDTSDVCIKRLRTPPAGNRALVNQVPYPRNLG